MNHDEMTARREELRLQVAESSRRVEDCRDHLTRAQLDLARHKGALDLLEDLMATAGPPPAPERRPRRDMRGMAMEMVREAGAAGITVAALGEACELKPTRAREMIDKLKAKNLILETNGVLVAQHPFGQPDFLDAGKGLTAPLSRA